jgi:hypothetical protein
LQRHKLLSHRSRSGGRTTSSDPLKKAAIRANPAGSNPPRGAAPHLSSDRSSGLGDSVVNILRRVPAQRLKVSEAADRRTAAGSSMLVGGACSKTPPRITPRGGRFPRRSEGRTPVVKTCCFPGGPFYVVTSRCAASALAASSSNRPSLSLVYKSAVQIRTALVVTPMR